jgi:predicted XRE-type DNA-binding protein
MIELPTAEIKRKLGETIVEIASQTNFFVAAKGLGIGTARLSDLRRGRVDRFTIDRLIQILAQVDRRVDVSVTVVGHPEVRWFAGKFPPRPGSARKVRPRRPLATISSRNVPP